METVQLKTRSDKSLGEICRKFLKIFGAKSETQEVNLDQCVQTLKIERRRIYDVVNILESFSVIKRI